MVKAKKWLIALACVFVGTCAMGFTACGKDKPVENSSAVESSEEESVCAHVWDKKEVEATCEKDGSITETCKNCGETKTSKGENKLGHDHQTKVVFAETCETDGYSEDICTRCGDVKANSKVVRPALGHDWVYGTWTLDDGTSITTDRCGRACLGETEKLDANGDIVLDADNKPVMVPAYLYASYNLEFDGTTVLGVGNCYDKKIYIPSDVAVIDGAFRGFDWITRVEIIGATEIGEDAFSDCVNVTKVVLGDQVMAIGANAFAGCFNLTEIEIPESVTSIGENAFTDCSSLQSVVIGSDDDVDGVIETGVTEIGEYAFSGCSALTTVVFGEGLETISAYAFAGSASLKEVTFSNTVAKIGEYAFSNCGELTTITFDAGSVLNSIGAYVFSDCAKLKTIEIPQTLAVIEDGAFSGTTNLTTIKIVDLLSWVSIEFKTENANPLSNNENVKLMMEDNKLENIVLPSTVTTINAYAFYGYKALKSVTINEEVTLIGDKAFANCVNLEKITYNAITCADLANNADVFVKAGAENKAGVTLEVGTSVTKIPANMFLALQYSDTANLTKINFLEDVCPDVENHTDTCVHINSACVMVGAFAFERTPVTEVKLSATIMEIGEKAFYRCEKLTNIVLPEAVTTIGVQAFDGCNAVSKASGSATALAAVSQASLKDVTITSGDITDKMFDACTALTTVVIEEGVTSIGRYAFAECPELANVTINAKVDIDKKFLIGEYAFLNCKALTTVTMEVEGDGVTEIGEGAFHNCKQLKTVSFDDALKTIGEVAFKNCEALKEITLGMNLKYIGAKAFEGAGLTSVDFLNRFNWYIGGSTETEWTTALATKATAAAYLTKVDDPATDVVEGYMDCVWENK